MSSTDVAHLEPAQTVIAKIRSDDFRQDLAAALPEGVSVDRFTRVVATALMDDTARQRDPAKRLTAADRVSLYQAVIKCAQDGLLPDGREAALVKRGDSVAYMPMVGGLRKIAGDHGWAITARVVTANDDFEHAEEPPSIRHTPVRPGVDRGEFVAAYAVARHKDGRRIQRVLYADEVKKRMAVATTAKVWNEWTEQMWEKTAARDVFADLPFDESESARITRIVQALEPGEAARALYGTEASPVSLPSPAQAPGATPEEQHAAAEAEPAQAGHASASAAATPEQDDEEGAPGPAAVEGEVIQEVDPAFQALADAASAFDPQSKKWPGMTIGEIFNHGDDGRGYIKWCLTGMSIPEKRKAYCDFARVYMPAEYQAASALAELAS